MTNALTMIDQRAIAPQERAISMARELMAFHPGFHDIKATIGEVEAKRAMLAVAHLALAIGASPLPSTNEIHPFNNRGRVAIQIGVNYYRRRARESAGGIVWQVRPQPMDETQKQAYGVKAGDLGAYCVGARADDLEKWLRLGIPVTAVWDMISATGIGVSGANEYAKAGRPSIWTAIKRAEVDIIRQLVPELAHLPTGRAPSANADALLTEDNGVIYEVDADDYVPTGADVDAINGELFGDGPVISAEPAPPPPSPAPAANGTNGKMPTPPEPDAGPLPDDELMIAEGDARSFVATAMQLLPYYKAKQHLANTAKQLGYEGIPAKSADRLELYRALKAHAADRTAEADLVADPVADLNGDLFD